MVPTAGFVWANTPRETFTEVNDAGTQTPQPSGAQAGESILEAPMGVQSVDATKATIKFNVAGAPGAAAPDSITNVDVTASGGYAISDPAMTAPTDFTLAGWWDNPNYVGSAWNFNNDKVTADKLAADGTFTLYAKWTYTAVYHANNGTDDQQEKTFKWHYARTLDDVAFARSGYKFAGWAKSASATSADYADGAVVYADENLAPSNDGKLHLYAVWEAAASTEVPEVMLGEPQWVNPSQRGPGAAFSYPNAVVYGANAYSMVVKVTDGSGDYLSGAVINNYDSVAPDMKEMLSDGVTANTAVGTWLWFASTSDPNAAATSKLRSLQFTYQEGVMVNVDVDGNTNSDNLSSLSAIAQLSDGRYFASYATDQSWINAFNSAHSFVFRGMRGYLAVPTSDGEFQKFLSLTHKDISTNTTTKWTYGWLGVTQDVKDDGSKISDDASVSTAHADGKLTRQSGTEYGSLYYAACGPNAGQSVSTYWKGTSAVVPWAYSDYSYDQSSGYGNPAGSDFVHAYWVKLENEETGKFQYDCAYNATNGSYQFSFPSIVEFGGYTDGQDPGGRSEAKSSTVTDTPTFPDVVFYSAYGTVPAAVKNVDMYMQAMEPGTDASAAEAAPTVATTGYTFTGWRYDGKLWDFESTVSRAMVGSDGNIALTAGWDKNKYYVDFNANGGTGTMARQAFEYGTEQALSENAFTRAGYTFKGWSTDSNSTPFNASVSTVNEVQLVDKATVKNLTDTDNGVVDLYAVWEKDTFAHETKDDTKKEWVHANDAAITVADLTTFKALGTDAAKLAQVIAWTDAFAESTESGATVALTTGGSDLTALVGAAGVGDYQVKLGTEAGTFVTATVKVRDSAASNDGDTAAISANDFYISKAEAQAAISEAAGSDAGTTFTARDVLVTRARAEAFNPRNTTATLTPVRATDVSQLQATRGTYAVTFGYKVDESTTVSVSANATVMDNAGTDDTSKTVIAANDFTVARSDTALPLADVVAKSGAVARNWETKADVAVGDMKIGGESKATEGLDISKPGSYTVALCAGSATCNITVTVRDQVGEDDAAKVAIAASDFTVAKGASVDAVAAKRLACASAWHTDTGEAIGLSQVSVSTLPSTDALGSFDVTFTVLAANGAATNASVTVKMTVREQQSEVDSGDVHEAASANSFHVKAADAAIAADEAVRLASARVWNTQTGADLVPAVNLGDYASNPAKVGSYDVVFSSPTSGGPSVTVKATVVSDAGEATDGDGNTEQVWANDTVVTTAEAGGAGLADLLKQRCGAGAQVVQTGAALDVTVDASAVQAQGGAYNVTFSSPAGATATVKVTVASVAANALTYNGADQALVSAASISGGTLVYSTTETGQYSTTIPTGKDAGGYTVWYKVQDASGDDITAAASVPVTINKKSLTVKAKNHSITYGDAPANDGVEYDGFVDSDKDGDAPKEGVLGGSLSYAYSYSQNDPVGNAYTITPSGLTSGNYAISFVAGTLTVGQRVAEFAWSAADTFVYDGTQKTYPKPTISNAVSGDDVAVGTYTGNAFTAKGDYTAVVGSLVGTKALNYTLPAAALLSHAWHITQAPNAVTVRVTGWTYGDAHGGPQVSALFGEERAAVAYYTDEACTAEAELDASGMPKNAGTYWARATIPGTDDYATAEATCQFTIAKKRVTVTAEDKQSQKGQGAVELSWAVSPALVGDDSLDSYVQLSCDIIATNTAGRYSITAGWKDDSRPANYEVTFVNGTYTVTRGTATVTATGWTGAYDGTADGKKINVEVTVTRASGTSGDGTSYPVTHSGDVDIYYSETDFATLLSGVNLNDLAGADTGTQAFSDAWSAMRTAVTTGLNNNTILRDSPTYSTVAGSPHKVYYLVVSDQVTPDVILGSKDVVINKAPLTVTAGSAEIAYGDAEPAYSATYEGFAAGEGEGDLTGTLALTCSYAQGSDAGAYSIVPSGLSSGNYDITFASGLLRVNRLGLDVAWTGGPFTYDGAEHAVTAELTGVYSGDAGDDAKVSIGALTGAAATNAGGYTARAGSLAGSKSYNYTLPSDASHAWVIAKRPVTVKAADQAVEVGAAVSQDASKAQLVGAVAGHRVSGVTLASTSTAARTTSGTITPSAARIADASGLDVSGNYAITYATGTLTVADHVTDADDLPGGEPGAGTHVVITGDDFTIQAGDSLSGDEALELSGARARNSQTGAAVALAADVSGVNTAALGSYDVKFTAAGGATLTVTCRVTSATGKNEAEDPEPWTDDSTQPSTTRRDRISAGDFVLTRDEVAACASDDALRALVVERSGATAVDFLNDVERPADVLVDLSGSGLAAGTAPALGACTVKMRTGHGAEISPTCTVVAAYGAENGKVIYVLHDEVRMSVARAAELLAATDTEAQLVELAGVHAFETATGAALPVELADDGGFTSVAGTYMLTFKTNPEVQARALVYDNEYVDPKTGTTVYANDVELDPEVVKRAKDGDEDAIAELIKAAGAVAVDADGNVVPVTKVDLSGVDVDKAGTYPVRFLTADGAGVDARVTIPEAGAAPAGADAGASGKTRPAGGFPLTGDQMGLLALLALALAAAAALAMRTARQRERAALAEVTWHARHARK